jgi:predicted transcriptional regulator
MRRSKLESYEAILEALLNKPLNIDTLAYAVSMDCVALRKNLDFLSENGLIEERLLPKETSYVATERGVTVFKTLNFQRYLKRIQNAITAMDDAMQVTSTFSRRKQNQGIELPDEKY